MKTFTYMIRSMASAAFLSAAVTAAAREAVPSPVREAAPEAAPSDTLSGVVGGKAVMKHNGDLMSVGLDLNLAAMELPANRAVLFTPVLRNGADSVALPPVGVYGRTRWYQYVRSGEPLGGEGEQSLRYSERPALLAYHADVPWRGWMDGSTLSVWCRDFGCCRELIGERNVPVTGYHELRFAPAFRYVKPAAEVKTRSLSGRAYVDFPVNRTEIHPGYRRNPEELRKIIGTIDSIRGDSDVKVSKITIKGYASPEGSYANNVRLARGRTGTLRKYVENMYSFGEGFIRTDYEPEDWEGLRAYVETSDLEHRAEILAIIDGDLEPDPKNRKIQTAYPEEYRFLLRTVYPGLRHSDYTIDYTIRGYSDPEEIAALLRTAPQKLSLEEMYLVARTLEAGSADFDEVFETAVRMYPSDETANLNAANAAMSRGDLKGAEKYLEKAGGSAEAEYARGMLAGLKGDFEGAKRGVKAAADLGMKDTEEMLKHIDGAAAFARLRDGAGNGE